MGPVSSRHAGVAKASTGPVMFFESRTITPTADGATSTQLPELPLKLLLRQATSTQLPALPLKLLFRHTRSVVDIMILSVGV
jgi:hypothetical protein